MKNNIQKSLIVLILSGLAYYFSSGFGAIWALMWLAPIPILIYAYSENLAKVALLAFLVGLAPGMNQIIGYWSTHLPMQGFIINMIMQSLEWMVIVIISRYFVKRLKHPISLFAYPTLLSLSEWLKSLGSQGSFNTIAYSQLHALPAMQIASITGFYGVSFVLSLFASSIAYAFVFHKTQSKTWLALTVSLFIVIASLSYGCYRMHNYKNTQANTITVGLVSYHFHPYIIYNPNLAMQLLNDYRPLINQLTKQGAKIILLPEESLSVITTNSAAIQNKFSQLAKQNHVTLIVGVNELLPHARYNSAWLFDAHGQLLGDYHKRHFVPGAEDGLSPGKKLLFFTINTHKAGIAICRDLDYPYPAHAYGKAGTNILFAPAWDFTVDAEVHSAGAFTRGIENGYTLVRAARAGYLSVTSPTGQVIAEQVTKASGGTTLLVNAPIWHHASFYAKHGNWFALLLLALLIIVIIRAFT